MRSGGALRPSILLIGAATFLLALGEGLWFRFAPRYLEALGASAIVVGAWASLQDLLDSTWQYPGGVMADRLGRKATLLTLTFLTMGGLALFLVPAWPVVLAGLVLYMANQAYAQPATFAVIGDTLSKEHRAMGFVVQSVLKRLPILLGVPAAGFLITTRLGVVHGVQAGVLAAIGLTAMAWVLQAAFYPSQSSPSTATFSFGVRDLPPTLRRLLVSDVLVRMGESATKAFVVLYVVTVLHFTDFVFGVMIALQTLVSLLVYVPAARWADRHGRKPWVALSFLFFSLFPLAVLFAGNYPSLIFAFVVAGLKEIGEPARKASITDMATDAARGRVVGSYYAVRGIAIVPVGIAAGFLWRWNPMLPFWVGACLGLVGLGLYLVRVPRE